MFIRLYTPTSKLYEIIPNPYTDNEECRYCTMVKNFKCNERYSFFGFNYKKELETTIPDNDQGWNIQLYLKDKTYNPEVIKVHPEHRVFTQLTENMIPIGWELKTKQDLEKLREYITENV